MTVNNGPREIELTLRLSKEAMERLREAPLVRQHTRSASRKQRLVSVYYDTVDHDLHARGLALRVRRMGRRFVQTLKAEPDGAVVASDRPEWEVDLAGPAPDLRAFTADGPGLHIGDLAGAALAPVFSTRIMRETMLLEWPEDSAPPALVELAFDRGRIEAGQQTLALVELELELKEGSPAALFAIAEELRKIEPVVIETRSKSDRGYWLACDGAVPAVKAPRVRLAPEMSVEEGLAAILRHCLMHWMRNEAAAIDGRDPEGIHQLRIALRRIRSALALFADVLDSSARDHWSDELRWLQGALAPAREFDVFLVETLRAMPVPDGDLAAREPRVLGLEKLAAAAEDARRQAYEELRRDLASERYADLLLRFSAWVEHAGWRQGIDVNLLLAQRQPILSFAVDNLAARNKLVRKRGRGFKTLAPADRHRLRVALKKLRYGVEFFADVFSGKAAKRFSRRLSKLQDQLGHLNDAAVAEKLVLSLVDRAPGTQGRDEMLLGGGALLGWHAARAAALEGELVAAWKAFKKIEPFWKDAAPRKPSR